MPVVSVVVIGYNDERRIGTAIRSACRQSLRDIEVVVVDDGSTDGTLAVAESWAQQDRRVKVVALGTNSGGCSRPRNAGMEHSTGEYVAFLDSDDVMPRQSCARLLTAAQRGHADMACGRFVRRHHDPTRYLPAHRWLYRRETLLRTILDRPEQLHDTPATGKLFRRAFLVEQGVHFPEGLLFEDLLFTTQAYCAADGIAIVPALTYVWNVWHGDAAASITRRRDAVAWRDRFEVHRRIDAFLAEHHASRELLQAKDRKFLTDDLTFYLRDLRQVAAPAREKMFAAATGYLSPLGRPLLSGPAPSRVAAFLLAVGDTERALRAADWSTTGGLSSDLTIDGSRLLFTGAHRDVSGAADALDVTGCAGSGWADAPYLVAVLRASGTGGRLVLSARVHDVLDRLRANPPAEATLLVAGRVGAPLLRVRADLATGADGLEMTASLDLRQLARRLADPRIGPELRLSLLLGRAGGRCVRPLTARGAELPDADLAVPGPWSPVAGDRLRVAERNGRLVLALVARPKVTERAIGAASWLRYLLATRVTDRLPIRS